MAGLEVSINGAPPITLEVQPFEFNFDGDFAYAGVVSDPDGEWEIDWSATTTIGGDGQDILASTIQISNSSDQEIDFQILSRTPVCPLGTEFSLIGGSCSLALQTNRNGGMATTIGADPMWHWSMDSRPAWSLFTAPFHITSSGAGVIQTTNVFGAPFPSNAGPAMQTESSLRLVVRLTDGETLTFQTTTIAAPDWKSQVIEPEDDACAADLNDDAVVDLMDLNAILATWGVEGECIPADLDSNGAVDNDDIAVLLGMWGGCS